MHDTVYQKAMLNPRKPSMENPQLQSENGDIIYLDKELYRGECKPGKEVFIKAKIASKGSKIGLTPIEIVDMVGDENEESESEENED